MDTQPVPSGRATAVGRTGPSDLLQGRARHRRLVHRSALAAGDAAAGAFSALTLLTLGRVGLWPSDEQGGAFVATNAVLLVLLHRVMGLYEGSRFSPVELFRLRVIAALVFAVATSVAIGSLTVPLALLEIGAVTFAVVLGVGLVGHAGVRRALVTTGLWCEPVVVVGEPVRARRLADALDANPLHGLRAANCTTPFLAPLHAPPEGVRSALLVASGDWRADLALAARLDYPNVILVGEDAGLQTLWLRSRAVAGAVGIEMRHGLLVAANLRLKRAFDLCLAVPALLVAGIAIGLGALAVWCVDRGDPFYAQVRTGRGGQAIRVAKLRTMYRDADARLTRHLAEHPAARAEWASRFKLRDDPRVLPGVGHLLRRLSIDELPQLLAVVRGELSLVGPRPFPDYHLSAFDETFQALRSSITPGLSGFWQITERGTADLAGQQRADEFYIHNWSVWLDLYILVHTVPAVLGGRGAR